MAATIRQIKAARALLGWSQADLAKASGISEPTIWRLEAADGALGGRANTGVKIVAALEAAGVIFVEENGEGPGVRLKKQPPAPAELTEKIEALGAKAASLDVAGRPSPQKAMNQMTKALVENEKTKLKNQRAKLTKKTPSQNETTKSENKNPKY
ncbi:transcriptional regulator, XRE family [Methylocella silvestris BL2]|uniref:Transcriptional regulator, XRE family n=1 Tax=Methylocella silvestris (strain DSM 15510 / CIP 108128 / LMG 27833 / NCIMB 13906 / BL2) TaxID=395965 RepID=B8EHZ9_METSB|nr:transcriptional regulator, XRE family [Methylocella silvestris BL2]